MDRRSVDTVTRTKLLCAPQIAMPKAQLIYFWDAELDACVSSLSMNDGAFDRFLIANEGLRCFLDVMILKSPPEAACEVIRQRKSYWIIYLRDLAVSH